MYRYVKQVKRINSSISFGDFTEEMLKISFVTRESRACYGNEKKLYRIISHRRFPHINRKGVHRLGTILMYNDNL